MPAPARAGVAVLRYATQHGRAPGQVCIHAALLPDSDPPSAARMMPASVNASPASSVCTRPPYSTSARSHRCTISGISVEWNRIAPPAST